MEVLGFYTCICIYELGVKDSIMHPIYKALIKGQQACKGNKEDDGDIAVRYLFYSVNGHLRAHNVFKSVQ